MTEHGPESKLGLFYWTPTVPPAVAPGSSSDPHKDPLQRAWLSTVEQTHSIPLPTQSKQAPPRRPLMTAGCPTSTRSRPMKGKKKFRKQTRKGASTEGRPAERHRVLVSDRSSPLSPHTHPTHTPPSGARPSAASSPPASAHAASVCVSVCRHTHMKMNANTRRIMFHAFVSPVTHATQNYHVAMTTSKCHNI